MARLSRALSAADTSVLVQEIIRRAVDRPQTILQSLEHLATADLSYYTPHSSFVKDFLSSVRERVLELTVDRPSWQSDVPVLTPTREEYDDFPSLMQKAKELGSEDVGVFKVILPPELRGAYERVDHQNILASTWTPNMMCQGIWELKRLEKRCSLSSRKVDFDESIDDAVRRFESTLEAGLPDARYITDFDASSVRRRQEIGLPPQSPIYPIKGDQLVRTKERIPGIHFPFAYKSGEALGSSFALHEEDGGLLSLNVLYYGTKVWSVIAPSSKKCVKDNHRDICGYEDQCAQSLRHNSSFVSPQKLDQWGARHLVCFQRPYEVIVIVDGALHQGFSLGSTLAEAVNYAPPGWTIEGYAECSTKCNKHPILNRALAFDQQIEMAPRNVRTTEAPLRKSLEVRPSYAGAIQLRSRQMILAKQPIPLVESKVTGKRKRYLPHGPSLVETMVAAVAIEHSIATIEQCLTGDFGGVDRLRPTSNDAAFVLHLVEHAERAGLRSSITRRFALAHLAYIYKNMLPKSPDKKNKDSAFKLLVAQAVGLQFPQEHAQTPLDKSGLLDSTDDAAKTWNSTKRRMRKRLHAGNRWLSLRELCGPAVFFLISPTWNSVNITDITFETMHDSEHNRLVQKIASKTRAIDLEREEFQTLSESVSIHRWLVFREDQDINTQLRALLKSLKKLST